MKLFHFLNIVVFIIISTLASSQATPLPNIYKAQLIKVIDADTIKLRLELYPGLFKEINLRITGIDAPESRRGVKNGVRITQCEVTNGRAATIIARKILENSKTLTVKNIDPSKTKYAGHVNGELWFAQQPDQATVNYGRYIINLGLAVAYTGGVRAPWFCM